MADWTWRGAGRYWVRHHGAFTALVVNGERGPLQRRPECHPACGDRGHLTSTWRPAPGAEHPAQVGRYSVGITGPTGTERYVLRDSLDGARAKLAAALVRRQRAWEERQRGS